MTPGELGEGDREKITLGQCPTCDQMGFRLGPQGGAAINIECVNCLGRFNVVVFGGECVMGQRIARETEGGGTWPAAYGTPKRGHTGTFS